MAMPGVNLLLRTAHFEWVPFDNVVSYSIRVPNVWMTRASVDDFRASRWMCRLVPPRPPEARDVYSWLQTGAIDGETAYKYLVEGREWDRKYGSSQGRSA